MICEPCQGEGCRECDGVGVPCPEFHLDEPPTEREVQDNATLLVAEGEVKWLEGRTDKDGKFHPGYFQDENGKLPWERGFDWIRPFRQRWRNERGFRVLIALCALAHRQDPKKVPGHSKLLEAVVRLGQSAEWHYDCLPADLKRLYAHVTQEAAKWNRSTS